MSDEINHPLQGSKYDKLFKENMHNILPGIIKRVLHLNVHTIEELADDVQFTKERKTDLLKKVKDSTKQTGTPKWLTGWPNIALCCKENISCQFASL